jgi:Tol biopolymer transport system component
MADLSLMHPSPQILAAFRKGKLDEAGADAVSRHLETCSTCRQAAVELSPGSFEALVPVTRPAGATLAEASPTPPPAPQPPTAAAAEAPLKGLPPGLADHPKFRVRRELGRGGMGVVYLAEHRLLEKPVALKVLPPEVFTNPGAVARFRSEVKSVGRLDHPNIVRALDAELDSEEAGGLHLLVMEYVEGQSLAQLVRRRGPLPVLHACNYVRQAALGLQHAFEQGMVHRDVKPHNLMLTPQGRVKVLDFGLARLANERPGAGRLTQLGAFVGTPEYVAPEQATDARTADTRSDIYSLGCTLYFLLAGRPPFTGSSAVEVALGHVEKEAAPLHELRPEVPKNLSAVVAKMMAKKPAARYPTPVEVAHALAPFCRPTASQAAAVPEKAGPPPARAVAPGDPGGLQLPPRDEPRKAPGPGGTPAVAMPWPEGSPFAGLGEPDDPPTARRRGAGREHSRSVRRMILAVAAAAAVVSGVAWLAVKPPTRVPSSGGKASDSPRRATLRLALQPPDAVVQVETDPDARVERSGDTTVVRTAPGRQKLRATREGRRPWEKEFELKPGQELSLPVELVPVPPAVVKLAVKVNEPMARVLIDGEQRGLTPGGGEPLEIELPSRPGKRVVEVVKEGYETIKREVNAGQSDSLDLTLVKVPPGPGAEAPPFSPLFTLAGHTAGVFHVTYSPDGKFLATSGKDATIRLWASDTGKQVRDFRGYRHVVFSSAFSPDGKRLASAGGDGTVRLWDVETGKQVGLLKGHSDEAYGVAFSPDGKTVASAGKDKTVRLWDVATEKSLQTLKGHGDVVLTVAFSPDGRRLASASRDGTLQVWNVAAGGEPFALRGGSSGAVTVAFSPDGRRLAAACLPQAVKVWELASRQEILTLTHNPQEVYHIAFSPDGRLLASCGGNWNDDRGGPVKVWDLSTRKELAGFQAHATPTWSLAFSPDGKRLATATGHWNKGDPGEARVWDLGALLKGR